MPRIQSEKSNLLKEEFISNLDKLVNANPRNKNKGKDLKKWCNDTFGEDASVSYVKEDKQRGNRISEQTKYKTPLLIFVCEDEINREKLIATIDERWYEGLQIAAIIGVQRKNRKNTFSFETLINYKDNQFFEKMHRLFNVEKKGKTSNPNSINDDIYNDNLCPVIYYGAPGTGKTSFVQEEIYARYHAKHRVFTTFHQSYSYEDFVEGLKPVLSDEDVPQGESQTGTGANQKNIGYRLESGILYNICESAAKLAGYRDLDECINDSSDNRSTKFNTALKKKKTALICIDEINRGNIAAIFGDLISLIEPSKRLGAGQYEMIVTLPYSKKQFGIPSNLFIVGTMNTADRSIQLLDSALRRRFRFVEFFPDYSKINKDDAASILKKINDRIRCISNKDHQIGHSYLMNTKNSIEIFKAVVDKIIPLLEEYFYNDNKKIRFILNENDKTDYPFFEIDADAQKAYQEYLSFDDNGDEDETFYKLNDNLSKIKNEADCKNYLKHLLE